MSHLRSDCRAPQQILSHRCCRAALLLTTENAESTEWKQNYRALYGQEEVFLAGHWMDFAMTPSAVSIRVLGSAQSAHGSCLQSHWISISFSPCASLQ